ncbi:MAG: selenium cofactor biosynthesis protein YqeC [Candidatus Krumholzibacteria bacterium]|nr:selenium cofactor biosynthesis protein YqeC [Candidatus Krumholzibacteria bacterium]
MIKLTEFLQDSRRIGILGSGGKSQLMRFLARHYHEQGERVLLTTSTKVYPFSGITTVLSLEELPELLRREGSAFFGQQIREGKIEGGVCDFVELADLAERILLEGDGARRCPLKVHLPHDPVLPEDCDTAIILLGASALGHPPGPDTLHRFEKAPDGFPEDGKVIRASDAARLALESYLPKAGPVPAAFLVNQSDIAAEEARSLAAELKHRWPGPVFCGSLKQETMDYHPAETRVSLLLLAAGSSRRYGKNKLAEKSGGKTLLERSAALWKYEKLEERILVQAPGNRMALPGYRTLSCEHPERGMSESLKSGLRILSRASDGLLLALGDMPLLEPDTRKAILGEIARHPHRPLRPVFRGSPGHPVYLPRSSFGKLESLEGDEGARSLMDSLNPFLLEVEDEGVILDVDVPGDRDKLERRFQNEGEDGAV